MLKIQINHYKNFAAYFFLFIYIRKNTKKNYNDKNVDNIILFKICVCFDKNCFIDLNIKKIVDKNANFNFEFKIIFHQNIDKSMF